MSQWTHVNAGIRFDGLPGIGPGATERFKPNLGRVCNWDDNDWEAWEDSIVPCGSEGSLKYNTVEYGTGLCWLAVHIWGDLRDYDSVDEIVTYLEKITKDKLVRDGVAWIEVEREKPVVVYYNKDTKAWVCLPAQ